MSDNLFFPEEILVEILHKLPSKSLVRCTTVCKSWRSIITHHSFISIHHCHSPSFLLIVITEPLRYVLRHDDPFLTHSSTLRIPFLVDRYFSTVALCNGLLCMATPTGTDGQAQYFIICNPSLGRFISLPTPRSYPCLYFPSIAFGFDSRNCDYKVVRITCMGDKERYRVSTPNVEVYSLSTGLWRNLDDISPVCHVGVHAPHAFVGGVVHWAAERKMSNGRYYFVLSFNFENEQFGEILLPDSLAHASSEAVRVTVFSGGGIGKNLTVYHSSGCSPCSFSIWVMKEYDVVESWIKVFAFNVNGHCLEAPSFGTMLTGVETRPEALCVTNRGEVLLVVDKSWKRCVYSLDIERERLTDLQIGPIQEYYPSRIRFLYSGYYSESLVLLNNKASGVVSY